MSTPDIAVCVVLAVSAAAALFFGRRKKSSCCGCDGCPMSGECEKKNKNKSTK